LKYQLETLAYSIKNRKQNHAPLRNLMFYGPPGTGKTLFAKKLAYSSGMDWAIMTGADVGPVGKNAVDEIHKMCDWAQQSSKGLIIFIDEADALFRKRYGSNENISEDLRNSINAFLYRTGTPSRKFMFVVATNTPEQLDKAVYDRIDQMICFDLPALNERKNLVYLFLVKYCDNSLGVREVLEDPMALLHRKRNIVTEGIDEQVVADLAAKTGGFSARELEKLIILSHDMAFSEPMGKLTPEVLARAYDFSIAQHKMKLEWNLNLS